MPRRRDSLPPPEDAVNLRFQVSPAVRQRLIDLAYGHGYSVAALLRLVAERIADDPEGGLAGIPKNPRKKR